MQNPLARPFWNFDLAVVRSKIWPPQKFLKIEILLYISSMLNMNLKVLDQYLSWEKSFYSNWVWIFQDFDLCEKPALFTK